MLVQEFYKENGGPSLDSQIMLYALQDKQLYRGTVPAEVKAKRRKKNKAARIARRANR